MSLSLDTKRKKGIMHVSVNEQSMRYTTYLFDLDDTLIPYARRAAEAWATLIACGVDADRLRHLDTALWPDVGSGRLPIEQKWFRQATESGATLAQADAFVQAMCAFEPPFQVLARLSALGCRLGVITNGPPGAHQRAKLEVAGLTPFFGEAVFISSEVGAAKPDPRIFEHALRSLGARPEETIFVGDNLHADALGAAGAGITAFWLNREGAAVDLPPNVQMIRRLSELPLPE
jgi:HAD superfamily hydrolase (TIGR01549 family)